MNASSPTPRLVPVLSSADPLVRLAPWSGVLRRLERRGVLPGCAGESSDAFENRIGTALMALYRDERSTEAFEALYAFSYASVRQWIQSLLSRGLAHLDPAELLQDTFVNVYRYPGAFRDEHAGSFRVWVRTIAGNIVRRAGVRRGRFTFQELPEGLQEPEDSRGNPLHRVQLEEQRRRLAGAWMLFLAHYGEAWKDLSQRDRRTLHLVEVEGLSYEEAGRVLAVGRSNMKMIVFRARKRIAKRMRQAMNAALFLPRSEIERQAS